MSDIDRLTDELKTMERRLEELARDMVRRPELEMMIKKLEGLERDVGAARKDLAKAGEMRSDQKASIVALTQTLHALNGRLESVEMAVKGIPELKIELAMINTKMDGFTKFAWILLGLAIAAIVKSLLFELGIV